jgi:hypothetical protein
MFGSVANKVWSVDHCPENNVFDYWILRLSDLGPCRNRLCGCTTVGGGCEEQGAVLWRPPLSCLKDGETLRWRYRGASRPRPLGTLREVMLGCFCASSCSCLVPYAPAVLCPQHKPGRVSGVIRRGGRL